MDDPACESSLARYCLDSAAALIVPHLNRGSRYSPGPSLQTFQRALALSHPGVVSGSIAAASLGKLLDTGSSDATGRIFASLLNVGVADARSSCRHKLNF